MFNRTVSPNVQQNSHGQMAPVKKKKKMKIEIQLSVHVLKF